MESRERNSIFALQMVEHYKQHGTLPNVKSFDQRLPEDRRGQRTNALLVGDFREICSGIGSTFMAELLRVSQSSVEKTLNNDVPVEGALNTYPVAFSMRVVLALMFYYEHYRRPELDDFNHLRQ